MGLGVLKDRKLTHVPGTVLLDDEAAHAESLMQGLKHGTGSNSHILLSPQPSRDPNDPLNWSAWKKERVFWVMLFGISLHGGVNGPFLNASFSEIADILHKPISKVVVVAGYNLLAAGIVGPLFCGLSRKYGKRPCFLVASLFCIAGTAIGEAKVSYKYLVAARIVQGVSTAAYDGLAFTIVGDLYFVHQRGLRIGLIICILNVSAGAASIIFMMFLAYPETAYTRDSRYETDVQADEKLEDLAKMKDIHHEESVAVEGDHRGWSSPVPARKTYAQELRLWNGTFSDESVLKFCIAPWVTLLNPAACYSLITCGIINSCYVGSAISLAGIFSGPPWNYTPSAIGNLSLGPFIAVFLGFGFISVTGDPVVKWMAKKNHGIYEPEFRLVFVWIGGPVAMTGMFLFGYLMSIGSSAILCASVFGIMFFGVMVSTYGLYTYGLDAFRAQNNEVFIMNNLFRNVMFYAFSNFVSDWVSSAGPQAVLYTFGGINCGIMVLTIPVYMFGMMLRSWWTRHDLMKMWKMEITDPNDTGGG